MGRSKQRKSDQPNQRKNTSNLTMENVDIEQEASMEEDQFRGNSLSPQPAKGRNRGKNNERKNNQQKGGLKRTTKPAIKSKIVVVNVTENMEVDNNVNVRSTRSRSRTPKLESKDKSKSNKNKRTKTIVNFAEGENDVVMMAQGDESEFQSDEEEGERITTEEDSLSEPSQTESNTDFEQEPQPSTSVSGNTGQANAVSDDNQVVTMGKLREFFQMTGLLRTEENQVDTNQDRQDEDEKEVYFQEKRKGTDNNNNSAMENGLANSSETTIYRQAILPENFEPDGNNYLHQISASSEEQLQYGESSDECDGNELLCDFTENSKNYDSFTGNKSPTRSADNRRKRHGQDSRRDSYYGEPRAKERREERRDNRRQNERKHCHETSGERRADQLIREAENAKARMYGSPGKNQFRKNKGEDEDSDYIVVAAHLEESLIARIARGEYIDFTHIIACDRVELEEDHRLELISQGGRPVWQPASDRDITQISSFAKWQQAFRVYSNVYMKYHPERAAELMEYSHIIHDASMTFTWANVYRYDKDFCLHMAKHTDRSWAIILSKAYQFRLKDRITTRYDVDFNNNNNSGKKREICRKFNKGKCTYGLRCKYDHWCTHCMKWGHGAHSCRKLNNSQGGNNVKRYGKINNYDQKESKTYKNKFDKKK